MESLGQDLLQMISENIDFLSFIKFYDSLEKGQKEIFYELMQYDSISEKQFIKIMQECLEEFLQITYDSMFNDLDRVYTLSKYGYDKDFAKNFLKLNTRNLYNTPYAEKLIKVYPDPEKTNLYYIGKNKNLDKSTRKEANRRLRIVLNHFEKHRLQAVLVMLSELKFKELLNLYLGITEFYRQDGMVTDKEAYDELIYCMKRKLRYMVSKFNRAIDYKTGKVISQTVSEYKDY